MRRLMLLLAVVAIAGAGVWLALRGGGADANTRITAILPRETLAFVHVPDFKRAREQWRETDIYKLWREPEVQAFLDKPLARMQHGAGAEERMLQLERIGMKDAFIAVLSWRNDAATIVGGFRFKGGKTEAEKVVLAWRSRLLPNAQQETVQHQRYRLDVMRHGKTTIASVYDEEWFFAANNVPALTALLDRINSRKADAAATLAADPTFIAAMKRMPATYAALAYARPEEFAVRLAARLPPGDQSGDRLAPLRQIRSVSAATTFENGKIRDVLFVAMPKPGETGELARGSAVLATDDTFFYLATLLSFPNDPAAANAAPPVPGAGFAAGLQRFAGRLSASGITNDDLSSAFGAELGVIGDWPANARLPGLVGTLPVKDAERADRIVASITDAAAEGSGWAVSDRDDVRYYSQLPDNPLLPISPTVAIGRDRAILGLDIRSVDAAIQRATSGAPSGLATSVGYQAAAGTVHAPRQSFTFIDTALLYTRLDAALRPMLIMGAAFVPAIAEAVDFSKVPPAEVITRHLSPIVMSQSYDDDGYFTESVGPASIYQAALGIAGATGAGANWYRANFLATPSGVPPLAPLGLPAPSPSPDGTP